MLRTPRRPETWLVVLASLDAMAWLALSLAQGASGLPMLCSTAALPVMPLSAALSLAFLFQPPARLACGWALMVGAMMLPLIAAPLRHVRDRSFARRRGCAALMFALGYFAVWMAAGLVLETATLVALWTIALPWSWLCLALVAAMLWQVSPAKQWCLNRCHRRPQLAAFEPAADRDVLLFGLTHGAACVGACWALMLPMLLAGKAQMIMMIAVALFVWAERLEDSAPLTWRWRGTGKAWRIAVAELRQGSANPGLISTLGWRETADLS